LENLKQYERKQQYMTAWLYNFKGRCDNYNK